MKWHAHGATRHLKWHAPLEVAWNQAIFPNKNTSHSIFPWFFSTIFRSCSHHPMLPSPDRPTGTAELLRGGRRLSSECGTRTGEDARDLAMIIIWYSHDSITMLICSYEYLLIPMIFIYGNLIICDGKRMGKWYGEDHIFGEKITGKMMGKSWENHGK